MPWHRTPEPGDEVKLTFRYWARLAECMAPTTIRGRVYALGERAGEQEGERERFMIVQGRTGSVIIDETNTYRLQFLAPPE